MRVPPLVPKLAGLTLNKEASVPLIVAVMPLVRLVPVTVTVSVFVPPGVVLMLTLVGEAVILGSVDGALKISCAATAPPRVEVTS